MEKNNNDIDMTSITKMIKQNKSEAVFEMPDFDTAKKLLEAYLIKDKPINSVFIIGEGYGIKLDLRMFIDRIPHKISNPEELSFLWQ